MKRLLFAFLLLIGNGLVNAQQTETAVRLRPVFSLGADLVPFASIERTKSLGFGGSVGIEFPSSSDHSFAATAGYLLFSSFPGSYSGFSDDFEFLPISLAWRKFMGRNFYLGPKLGLNIEVASPQFDDFKSSAATMFGGLAFGSRPTGKRLQPDFSLLYHGASYGSIFSLQASLRFQFGKR